MIAHHHQEALVVDVDAIDALDHVFVRQYPTDVDFQWQSVRSVVDGFPSFDIALQNELSDANL